ncbi:FlxA-like family protein [Parashewanella tropica]|uniref:FlxA-like family protein n=1 Tax=Parashewanella tropica TaxID=2547970 RepID=UPI00105A8398|nr:FlxA-like family protein [Parashewanella tropica]
MRKSLVAAGILLGLSGTVNAADTGKLEQMILAQEAQLKALKAELEQIKLQQAQQTVEKKSVTGTTDVAVAQKAKSLDEFVFKSYGSAIYTNDEVFENVQDTTPTRRGRFDLERIVTEFGYRFNNEWDFEVEVEFEHGGTGATLEYDGFEEAGEFESEIEAGGEVVIEKAQFRYRPSDSFGIKFGNIHVPVGLGTILHKPNQHLTVMRHKSEATLIPTTWNEFGIGVFGQLGDFNYQAQIINGLNSEYFRSYGWVSTGHQTRFEHVNADDFAGVVRLDYGNFKKDGLAVGAAYYYGFSAGNRHNDGRITGDGTVQIGAVSGAYVEGPWILRGQYLYGTLSDADEITLANKTTPGLRPGGFSQVGSKAVAYFVEAGVDLKEYFDVPVTVFANIDYSNPVKEVESGVATKRFEQTWTSLGVNYFPIPQIVLKAEAGRKQIAVHEIPDTYFFNLGVGYQFSL